MNKEQHLLRELGLGKGRIRRLETAANTSLVIPLNGVSRVRIPPPPLPKPPICRTNARARKRIGERSDPVDTTFDTDATRKVFSRTSLRVGHGAARWAAQQERGDKVPAGYGCDEASASGSAPPAAIHRCSSPAPSSEHDDEQVEHNQVWRILYLPFSPRPPCSRLQSL